eukprot:1597755-Lingulodinium_polyedra.AAC.1
MDCGNPPGSNKAERSANIAEGPLRAAGAVGAAAPREGAFRLETRATGGRGAVRCEEFECG